MKYKIALGHDEEGYSVSVPGLPGCWSQGANEAEAIANIANASREYWAGPVDLAFGSDMREIEVAAQLGQDSRSQSPSRDPGAGEGRVSGRPLM